MTRFMGVFTAALLSAPVAGLSAQASTGVLNGMTGEEVRIAVGDRYAASLVSVHGTLVEVRNDSLLLMNKGGPSSRIAMSDVRGLDVKRGKDRVLGAKRGAVIGAAFGLLMSVAPKDCASGYGIDCRADGSTPNDGEYLRQNVVGGVMSGIMVGAWIGVTHWEPVMIRQQQRVSIAPTSRGVGLKVAF